MKKILISLAAVASCGLAGSAFAQNGMGGATREDVLAELRLLRATGELEERQVTELTAVEVRAVDKADIEDAKTREEVRQELIEAREARRVSAWTGSDSHTWEQWVPQG